MENIKKLNVLLLVFFVFSAGGFIMIHETTIKPYQYSGNGNFGILFMMPTIPLYLIFLFLFGRFMTQVSVKFGRLILLSVIVISLLVFAEMAFIKNLVGELGGGPDQPDSRIFRFGWFNQYTNSIYFNWMTFIMGMCLSTFISSCISIARAGRK